MLFPSRMVLQEHMEDVVPLLEEISLCIPDEFVPYVHSIVPLLLASLEHPE